MKIPQGYRIIDASISFRSLIIFWKQIINSGNFHLKSDSNPKPENFQKANKQILVLQRLKTRKLKVSVSLSQVLKYDGLEIL
jgi:hypothetical protein